MDEATKQRRNELLGEQHDLQTSIGRLQETLKRSGATLKQLGDMLTLRPSEIGFSNAPDGLSSYSTNMLGEPAKFFHWEEVSNLTEIARNVQQLRTLKARQSMVEYELEQLKQR